MNSIVMLVDTDVLDRRDERVKAQLGFVGNPPIFNWTVISRAASGSIRLPRNRTLSLIIHAEPEATPTTIRVFVLGFEIGKGT